MGVNFTPEMGAYTGQGAFRFWCQKVLPLVYDDSLSYYELLNKVVNYLNNVIKDVATVEGNVEGLLNAYNQLQDYVNNYFDNLDVQHEIDVKLDLMTSDGTFTNLLGPIVDGKIGGVVGEQIGDTVAEQLPGVVGQQIDNVVAEQLPGVAAESVPGVVTNWLNDNVTPVGSAIMVDSSLTVSGAAADAKVTGDRIVELKESIEVTADNIYRESFMIPRAYYYCYQIHAAGNFESYSTNRRYFENEPFYNVPGGAIISVKENEYNIQIADNSKEGSLSWGTKLHYNNGDVIRFLVRFNNGAVDIPSSMLDYIYMYLSTDGMEYFIQNYTMQKDTTEKWTSAYRYYQDPSINGFGTRIMGGTIYYAMRYPFYKPKSLLKYTPPDASTTFDYTIIQSSDVVTYIQTSAHNNDNPIEITGNFIWEGHNKPRNFAILYTEDSAPTNGLTYQNIIFFDGAYNYGRTAAACMHGDYYYFLADTVSVPLRKVSKETLEVVAEYPDITGGGIGVRLGHTNGSNLVGDVWYISDYYLPNTIHTVILTNDEPIIGEDITIPLTENFPNVERASIFVANDNTIYAFTVGKYADTGTYVTMCVTFIKHVGTWKVADCQIIPTYGVIQDVHIVDDTIYIPMSKSLPRNQYSLYGILIFNLGSGKSVLCDTTHRTEPEAIIEYDDNNLLIFDHFGVAYIISKTSINWNQMAKISYSQSAYDAINLVS